MTERVCIKTGDHYDAFIGRPGYAIPKEKLGHDGYYGNPFYLHPGESRGDTLLKYEKWFHSCLELDAEFKRKIHLLKGKKLGCFCRKGPCHGDVIINYLEYIMEKNVVISEIPSLRMPIKDATVNEVSLVCGTFELFNKHVSFFYLKQPEEQALNLLFFLLNKKESWTQACLQSTLAINDDLDKYRYIVDTLKSLEISVKPFYDEILITKKPGQ